MTNDCLCGFLCHERTWYPRGNGPCQETTLKKRLCTYVPTHWCACFCLLCLELMLLTYTQCSFVIPQRSSVPFHWQPIFTTFYSYSYNTSARCNDLSPSPWPLWLSYYSGYFSNNTTLSGNFYPVFFMLLLLLFQIHNFPITRGDRALMTVACIYLSPGYPWFKPKCRYIINFMSWLEVAWWYQLSGDLHSPSEVSFTYRN